MDARASDAVGLHEDDGNPKIVAAHGRRVAAGASTKNHDRLGAMLAHRDPGRTVT